MDLPPVAFDTTSPEQRPTSKDREQLRIPLPMPTAQQAQVLLTVDELCALFHTSPSIMRRELVQLGLRQPHDLTTPSQEELHAWRRAHERGDHRLDPSM
jgi:hypothetical protein